MSEKQVRAGLGVIGLLMILYGVVQILRFPSVSKPIGLAEWMIAAVILHDGVLVPIVSAFGLTLARVLGRRRIRAYVQGGAFVAAVVVALALVMNHRHGKSEPGKALLEQDYLRNAAILLGIVAAATIALYLTRLVRDRLVRDRLARDRPSSVR